MRLPTALYQAVKPVFAHHSPWHLARVRSANLPSSVIPAWQAARQQFPNAKFLDEVGSGEEFLRFHRVMVRNFKWLIATTPNANFQYQPWQQFPQWLINLFDGSDPQFLPAANAEIAFFIQDGTADELGAFIEATNTNGSSANNVHNLTHGTVAGYEQQTFGANNPNLVDASMRSTTTAPHNEHFWGLHGWIDEIFARWQVAHGEVVDQGPLAPSRGGHIMTPIPFALHTSTPVGDKLHAVTETTFTLEFPAIWDRQR